MSAAAIVCALLPFLQAPATTNAAPLRVFLRGGEKTHGPGQHDHPRFVAEWKTLLEERGAIVRGELRFPTRDELAQTDVLVLYAAEGGSIHGTDRENLAGYLARGGGIVALHDAVCGDDAQWFKGIVGGAWEHGHSKWREGATDVLVTPLAHPITRGAASFRFDDELYYDLHFAEGIQVLAQGFHSVFDVTPQMWTYEPGAYRAFVSLQGHQHASFAHPGWRTMLLRGIAWAAQRDADALLAPGEAESVSYPPGGPTRPELAATSLEPHPDFELSLVAAEPLVAKPIAIDWDAQGRAWIAETPGYPDKERFSGIPAHDSISILVDDDRDGRADRKQVFATGLDLVTGFVFHRDGVIVSCAPDVLWLRDRDGDGTSDERVVLFTGFGFGDTHAVLSNLREGPDGWIYATQGYSGNASKNVRNAQGRDFGAIGNGVVRFRPDGSAIEVVSSYGSNTWGVSFAPDGELFFTMANGAHVRHVVVPERLLQGNRIDGVESWTDLPDHDRVVPIFGREDAPYAQIDFVGGFTAASGSIVYDGGAWPAEWDGAHFTNEPTVHLVHHDVLTPRGVTFAAKKARDAEFLAGRDPWFRPVDARVGPDGALYVLDFYNLAVVHNDTRGPKHGPTNAAVRPDRDHHHGRVWRMQHKRARDVVSKPLAEADTQALVAALASDNGWTRRTAARLLVERGAREPRPPLTALVASAASPLAAIDAAWTLHRLSGAGDDAVRALSARSEASAKRAALRIAALEAPSLSRDASIDRIVEALVGDDARARLLALAAAGELELDVALTRALVDVWSTLDDPWSRSLAVRAARRDPARMLAAVASGAQGARRAAGATAEAPAGAKGAVEDDAKAPMQLVTHAARAAVAAEGVARASDLVVEAARSQGLAPLDLAELLRSIERGLARNARPSNDAQLAASMRSLLAHTDARVALAALTLVGRACEDAGVAEQTEALRGRLARTIADTEQPSELRVEALEVLVASDAHRPAAVRAAADLLAPSAPAALQARVLEACARVDDRAVAVEIAKHYPKLAPAARDRAFDLAATRASSSQAFLDALEAREIALADLGPQKAHRLRNHPDAATAERAVAVLDALRGGADAKVEALLAQLLPEVDGPGDAAHGKQVFVANCAACHVAFGAGGKVGPDLTGIGTHGARDLLPILLDPNRTVEAGYSEWVVTTLDERVYSGVLVRDASDAVVLRSTAGDQTIERAEIESMRDTGRSPMPSGFESLGAKGLRDVVAYLAGDFAGFRVIDLSDVVTSSSLAGLYDTKRDAKPMTFRRYGVVEAGGVPFEVLDPRRTQSGANAIVLQGGMYGDWESKIARPRRVEIAVGFALERVHVLGGIAAWGFPTVKEAKRAARWTWNYADGTSEVVELLNGDVFADWIGRFDVPGSTAVEGVLGDDSWGQLRMHALAPGERKVVASIVLESDGGEIAPTFFALTAELAGAVKREQAPPLPVQVLAFGGGSSHDFGAWFERADLATLKDAGFASTRYTSSSAELARSFGTFESLVLSTNQPLADTALRTQFMDEHARGLGLVVLHPAAWHNWTDWPEYNARVVGGGARSHEPLQEFEVRIVAPEHALARGVPATFRVIDELYRFERAKGDAAIEVVAIGRSLTSGAEFPVVFTVERAQGRTAVITLGHDGAAHEHAAFKALLANAVRYVRTVPGSTSSPSTHDAGVKDERGRR